MDVITSYSIHYTKLYDIPSILIQLVFGKASIMFTHGQTVVPERLISEGFKFKYDNRITSYNVCYTKLLRRQCFGLRHYQTDLRR